MLDHKMDSDLLFDVREFLVTTLADEKLSDQTQGIRHDLVRRLTTAQSFHTKPYQDMKPSPKKDKSELILLPHHHHLTHLHTLLSDHETQYENESCTSSGGSTSGAGSIECYEEIDSSALAINNQLNSNNTANTYENISKISPSPSTMSVLSTSQYNELTAQISNNARVSNQYENTKQMLNMVTNNGNNSVQGSVMSTKHGQVEIVNTKSLMGSKKADDTVDGDMKSATNTSNGISNNGPSGMNGLAGNGLKAGDRKSSNGSMLSLHDIKFSGILGGDSGKILNDIESQLSKHKSLNGSISYPLGGTAIHGSNSNLHLQNNLGGNLQNNLGNLQNLGNLSHLQNGGGGVSKTGTLPASTSSSSSSSTTSSTKNLSNMNSNNVEILSISASALKYSAARCGNLLKKEKILFVDHFKKYWMALVNGYLYLYNNDKDSKATSVINAYNEAEDTRVYTARPSISKEKDNLFEIVAPGQKTHYFAANSNADMDLWITAINQCGQTPNSPTKSICSNSSSSSSNSPLSSSFGAPISGKPSRPGSLHTSDTSRELPSLPTTPVVTVFNEGLYDEPDALIRPVLHNYEHMINQQDSLYNEIDEKESTNENYYNISAHESRQSPSSLPTTPSSKTECHTPSHPTHRRQCSRSLDFEREQEKLRELNMATYDQPKSNQRVMDTHPCGQMEEKGSSTPNGTQEGKGSCSGNSGGIPEMDEDEEAGDEKNCEETSELFANNCQSNRIQHIIQRMEASSQQQTTPTQRRTKRPESQLIVSMTEHPLQRKSSNRNSR